MMQSPDDYDDLVEQTNEACKLLEPLFIGLKTSRVLNISTNVMTVALLCLNPNDQEEAISYIQEYLNMLKQKLEKEKGKK